MRRLLFILPIFLFAWCSIKIETVTHKNNITDIYNVLSVYDFVKFCEKKWWIIMFPKQEEFVVFTKELFDYHFPKAFVDWWFYKHIQVKPPSEPCCEMHWWCYPMWRDWPNEEYNYKHFESEYWFIIR